MLEQFALQVLQQPQFRLGKRPAWIQYVGVDIVLASNAQVVEVVSEEEEASEAAWAELMVQRAAAETEKPLDYDEYRQHRKNREG